MTPEETRALTKPIAIVISIILVIGLMVGIIFFIKNSRIAEQAEFERPQVEELQAELKRIKQELTDTKERLAYYTDIEDILQPVVGTPSVSPGSPIVVLSPAGGQSYCKGSQIVFRWQTPTSLGPVSIYALRYAGATPVAKDLPIVTKNPFNIPIGTGEYVWDMRWPERPYELAEAGGNYKFQISSHLDGHQVITETDGYITIRDCTR